jgi:Zn-dependent peptidase ImmA (M78 family)
LGTTERRVERWEVGLESPDLADLERLAAHVYRRPLAALLLPAPPERLLWLRDFRVLPAGEREPFSPKVFLAYRQARRVARILKDLSGEGSGHWLRTRPVALSMNPELTAEEERSAFGIDVATQLGWSDDKEAFRVWRKSLESRGVVVLQLSMPVREARGFSMIERGVPVIVVNTRDAMSARSFSLFHEYAHLLLNESGVCRMDEGVGDATEARVETFCNRFAASFLVPREAIQAHSVVRRGRQATSTVWEEATLRKLARDFKVSRDVVLLRLVAIERASRTFYEQKREDWAAPRPLRKGGRSNPPKDCLERLGTPFVRTVLASRESGLLTRSDVADYLGIRMKHVPRVVRLARQEGA